jgi:hypothetical protein
MRSTRTLFNRFGLATTDPKVGRVALQIRGGPPGHSPAITAASVVGRRVWVTPDADQTAPDFGSGGAGEFVRGRRRDQACVVGDCAPRWLPAGMTSQEDVRDIRDFDARSTLSV